jgi:C1A family cysteine protease
MRNLLLTKVALSALGVFSLTAYANEVSKYYKVEGSHSVIIPIKSDSLNTNSYDLDSLTGVKTIQLMTIAPTEAFYEKNRQAVADMIAAGGEIDYRNGITPFTNSSSSVDLGMANVPVLDQGAFGTCVTFASTAALDARLQKGDFIDQQCSLALNKYLGNNYWNGAYDATEILAPLKQYGIISKGNCFNKKYPNTSQSVSPKTYQTKSDTSFASQINYTYTGTANINIVKAALRNGNRVAIGTGLADTSDPISVNGFNVKVKDNNKTTTYKGGLWACQQPGNSSNYCSVQNAGHEVVITGFDDTQQLFKIRNSWSALAGAQGEYYMTYAFFNAMVMDHTSIN